MLNMRKILLGLLFSCFATFAQAAGSTVSALPASGAITGAQLLYCPIGLSSDVKCTFTQVATFINSLFSGDCTVAAGGGITCTKTNGTAFGALATTTPGTGIATALGVNVGTAGAPVINGGAGGTPSSLTLTNALGLPAAAMPALTGDCTTSAGAVATTCTKTSGTAFGALATVTPGTGVATAAANNLSAAGGITTTIASGTAAMGTGAISSATCATVVTVAAANVATTDVVMDSFNGDPTGVTGYAAATTGMLTIIEYPTSGNVNFKVCNNTLASITPGAITLNWRVVR
jgi:hypothetical protein